MKSVKPTIWSSPGYSIIGLLYSKVDVTFDVLEEVRRRVCNRVGNIAPTFSHFENTNDFR